ncbi:MAG: nucleotidyltransferase domain-containing protein [Deferrisomatales bacterium]|nr:nucleotidyltransferase domain-containing protein [Deferrisomatales bacterium]
MVDAEVLNKTVARLVEQFHPERVILFGSQARGTADSRSDVDLLVVCRDPGDRRALMTAMDRSLRGLPVATDIIVMTPDEFETDRRIPGTLARPAAREGRVLYERA